MINFNPQQEETVRRLEAFMASGSQQDREFILSGYAGTGKTTVCMEVISRWIKKGKRFAITAPTNKAVKVAQQIVSSFGVEATCMTTYSLLALELRPDGKGGEKIFPSKTRDPDLGNYDVVIVDEASMIKEELNDFIQHELMMYPQTKIIYMGDIGQLNPVGEGISVVFDKPQGITLTEVMRQANDNPLGELIAEIRDQLDKPYLIAPNRIDRVQKIQVEQNGTLVDIERGITWTTRDEMLAIAIEHFKSNEYRKDSDYARIMSWTNREVDYFNREVRKAIYGPEVARAKPFIPGERLITNSPIVQGELIVYPTSEELEIKDVRVGTVEDFKCWTLDVKSVDTSKSTTIQVLHRDSVDQFKEALDREKIFALDGGYWKNYYRLKQQLFASVGYSFAITVHKSQGSTYKNTFVNVGDILKNRNKIKDTNRFEANHCLYTAMTRASLRTFAC